ncbi:hypothetical protein L1987_23872 [Smallanthus sonchifolius]|uniref:Uncharacterized protein n=1 Tax=Smallanthus sonchifolius TaxID=185202 RepID=A0ACB9IJ33_9ASTR|nr:hypothetical protein L1987_23872 [Smallanthus sonchifolius]
MVSINRMTILKHFRSSNYNFHRLFAYCLTLPLSAPEKGYCMAANLLIQGIASLGKRFASQIRPASAVDPNLIFRRLVHVSVYDKNIDEQVRPSFVPEEAITRTEPEKYWAPHPKTGVFLPADEKNLGAIGSEPAAVDGSVLEEKTFFRTLENLDKPTDHP